MKRVSVFLLSMFLFGCPPVKDPEISRTSLQMSELKKAYLLSLDEAFAPVGYEISGSLQEWFNSSLKKEITAEYTDPITKEKSSVKASVTYGLESNAGGLVSLSGQTFLISPNPDGASRSFSVSVLLKMGESSVSFSHLFTVAPDSVLVALQIPSVALYRGTKDAYEEIGGEDWNLSLDPALWTGDWLVLKGFTEGLFYYKFNEDDWQLLTDAEKVESGIYKVVIPGDKTGNVVFSAYVEPGEGYTDKLKASSVASHSLSVNSENLSIGSTSSITVSFWDFDELYRSYSTNADDLTGETGTTILEEEIKEILKPFVSLNPNFGQNYYDGGCYVSVVEPLAEDTRLKVTIYDSSGNETPETALTLGYAVNNGGRFRLTSYFDKSPLNAVYDYGSSDGQSEDLFSRLRQVESTFTVIGAVTIADGFASSTAYPFFTFSQKDQNRLISMLMWGGTGSGAGSFGWRQYKDSAPTAGLRFTGKTVPAGSYIFVFSSGDTNGGGNSFMGLYPINGDGSTEGDLLGNTSYNPSSYGGGEEKVYRGLSSILTPENSNPVSFSLGRLPSTVSSDTWLSSQANLSPDSAVWNGLKWGDPSSLFTIYHFEIWDAMTIDQAKSQGASVAAFLTSRGICR